MIKKEREEQIRRWAEYVRNSNGKWRKPHSAFINSQFEIANSFYKRLSRTKAGRDKIKLIKKQRSQALS